MKLDQGRVLPTKTSEILLEAIAQHEAFRRMQVPPEHIFFGVWQHGVEGLINDGLVAIVQVKRPDGFHFTSIVGRVKNDKQAEAIYAAWPATVNRWNKATKATNDKIWKASWVLKHATEFVQVWTDKLISWQAAQ